MASFEEKFRESIESALSELNLEWFWEDSNEPNESYSKYKITDEDNLNKRILTIQKDQDKANEENRKITASQTQIQKAQKNILNIITTVIVVIAITII